MTPKLIAFDLDGTLLNDEKQIPEENLCALKTAQEAAALIRDKLHADGLNIVQNNGETAGQTVHHFHIHIIPRYKGDGQNILWRPNSPSGEELDDILKKITG